MAIGVRLSRWPWGLLEVRRMEVGNLNKMSARRGRCENEKSISQKCCGRIVVGPFRGLE